MESEKLAFTEFWRKIENPSCVVEVFQIKLDFSAGLPAQILDILDKVGEIWAKDPEEKDFLDGVPMPHNSG